MHLGFHFYLLSHMYFRLQSNLKFGLAYVFAFAFAFDFALDQTLLFHLYIPLSLQSNLKLTDNVILFSNLNR